MFAKTVEQLLCSKLQQNLRKLQSMFKTFVLKKIEKSYKLPVPAVPDEFCCAIHEFQVAPLDAPPWPVDELYISIVN